MPARRSAPNAQGIRPRAGARGQSGFTLVELLIAMLLTSVIGIVLFSTYRLVVGSVESAGRRITERESRRIFRGVVDTDLAGLRLEDNGTLPPLSREPITLPEAYRQTTKTKDPKSTGDKVLLSFAGSFSLAEARDMAVPGPVCIEYTLRAGRDGSWSLLRREREHCGVDGEFPWTEMVLARGLRSAKAALYRQGAFVEDWRPVNARRDAPWGICFSLEWEQNPGERESFLVPLFPWRSYVRNTP